MKPVRDWLKRFKAKHWDIDIDVIDDPQIIGFFESVPPLRAKWEALAPWLKRYVPDIAVGVLAGIITTLILRLLSF